MKMMTNNRDFSCELTGLILSKKKKKVYDKANPFYGNTYYCLKIRPDQGEKGAFLFVYSNLVSLQIFNDIEQSHFVDKRYLFFCEKRPRGLVLQNWRELTLDAPPMPPNSSENHD